MKHRALSIAVRTPLLALAVLLAVGCSSDGSPTESRIEASTATLTGSVTLGSQGVVVGVAEDATAGVTVRIQGTGLSTATDASGDFSLPGVPTGNQVVVFESGQSAAPLPVEEIQPDERIEIDVTVRGSSVTVDSMDRSSESGPGNDEQQGDEGDEGEEGEEEEIDLSLEIQPRSWNLEWEHSSGTVSALIRGAGFERIDLGSIVLVGTSGDELEPASVRRQGNHVRARFDKTDALATLDDPEAGEMHDVIIRLLVDEEEMDLTFAVRIVGPEDDDEGDEEEEETEPLSLEIQPRSWNTNWDRSSGTVSAFIRGDAIDEIDLDSILLVGTSGDELAPASVGRQGNNVRARFGQADAFATLDDPQPGEMHTIVVRFEVDGAEEELTFDVKIVGSS